MKEPQNIIVWRVVSFVPYINLLMPFIIVYGHWYRSRSIRVIISDPSIPFGMMYVHIVPENGKFYPGP